MTTTLVTTVFTADRLCSSRNGNPRYALNTANGRYKTARDAGCAYAVPSARENYTAVLGLNERLEVVKFEVMR